MMRCFSGVSLEPLNLCGCCTGYDRKVHLVKSETKLSCDSRCIKSFLELAQKMSQNLAEDGLDGNAEPHTNGHAENEDQEMVDFNLADLKIRMVSAVTHSLFQKVQKVQRTPALISAMF